MADGDNTPHDYDAECGIRRVCADKLKPGDQLANHREPTAVRAIRATDKLMERHPSKSAVWEEFDEKAKARILAAVRCVEIEYGPVSGGPSKTRIERASEVYEVWTDA